MSNSSTRFSFSQNGSTTEFNDEEQDDDMMSSALGDSPRQGELESDEEEDEEDGYVGAGSNRRRWVNPDILYQDEFGYWLVKLLRGSTSGRRIKRCVFKIAVVGIVCSIALIVISYLESYLYSFSAYFNTSPFGATLQSLMYVAAYSEAFMSVMSLVFVKYWASVVTNRKLFVQVLRLYMIMQLATSILGIWMVWVLYKTFEKIDRWMDDLTLATMFPYVLCTWMFSLPYIAVTLYYTMDISFYMDDLVTNVGVIEEENPPADRVDLSDVSFNQVALLIVAFPVMLVVQFLDLLVALVQLAVRYVKTRQRERHELQEKRAKMKAAKLAEKTRGSSVSTRVLRTMRRHFRFCCSLCIGKKKKPLPVLDTTLDDIPASPYAMKPTAAVIAPAKAAEPKNAEERELVERKAREAAMADEERRAERRAAEVKARLEAEATRLREEREREEEFELAEIARRLEEEKKDAAPTLDVPRFKALWATIASTGSFSAKLRALPSLSLLTEHMRKQGFHVVFASAPTMNDVEVGICNIRARPNDKWFMARFVGNSSDFSAVMKSEDPDTAAKFVKMFSLAKVLKIDTTRTQVSNTGPSSPQR